jgi:hypothetical protein
MAAQEEFINQDLSKSIRTLKINAKDLKKVLKEAVKTWMGELLLEKLNIPAGCAPVHCPKMTQDFCLLDLLEL